MLAWTTNSSAQAGIIGVEEPNLIQQENELPGDFDWQIPVGNQATSREIEGYASAASVNVGKTITFYVNVNNGSHLIDFDIYRMGYYGGAGARRIFSRVGITARPQALPEASHVTGLAECAWEMPVGANYTWTVPGASRWSGVYLAKITANVGQKQSYIIFVVRDDDRVSDYLFQTSVTTYQAYNFWPANLPPSQQGADWDWFRGKSLYAGGGDFPLSWGPVVPAGVTGAQIQARKVSFNRPYYPDNGIYGTAGQFFFRGEYNMLRWMEQNNYDVSYTTDVDTDAATDMVNGPLSPGRHKVFLSVGHDEYWTWQMRENLEKARNRPANEQPLNIGWFGANDVHWQIRFENSSGTGSSSPANAPRRTIVAYKQLARNDNPDLKDPFYVAGGSVTNYLTTSLWRENKHPLMGTICPSQLSDCSKDPEDELLGVMTNLDNPVGRGHFTFDLDECPQWVVRGVNHNPFTALVGYEADAFFNYYPASRDIEVKIATSEFVGKFITTTANAFYYTRDTDGINNGDDGGARVFAAGTIEWGLGLNDFGADPSIGPVLHIPYYDPRVEGVTRNILACLRDGGEACKPDEPIE
jgi:hypothetical protein